MKKNWIAGDRIDVLDAATSIYCPAIVSSCDESTGCHIMFLGWEDSFNETIKDFSLISPAGRFVHKRKAWVKLSNKYGFWPAIVYLRTAWSAGDHDQFGKNNLKHTNIIFVQPYAPFKIYHANHGGYWAYVNNVTSFSTNKQHRINAGMQSKFKTEFALHLSKFENETRNISSSHFELEGSLPVLSIDDRIEFIEDEENAESASAKRKLKHEPKKDKRSELNVNTTMNSLIDVMKCGYSELKLHQKSNLNKRSKTESWSIQTHFAENFLRIQNQLQQIRS